VATAPPRRNLDIIKSPLTEERTIARNLYPG
jgi:hypothetical protein